MKLHRNIDLKQDICNYNVAITLYSSYLVIDCSSIRYSTAGNSIMSTIPWWCPSNIVQPQHHQMVLKSQIPDDLTRTLSHSSCRCFYCFW